MISNGDFVTDRASDPPLSDAALRLLAATPGQELTYTCVPPGSGVRAGIDRDLDGFFDRDEVDAGADPADELDIPCLSVDDPFVYKRAKFKDSKGKLALKAEVVLPAGYSQETIQIVAADGGGVILDDGVLGSGLIPNKKGNAFRYKGPKKTPGITRVIVKENKKVVDGFRVTVKTKEAWLPPSADETEGTTFVLLNIGGTCSNGNATKVK